MTKKPEPLQGQFLVRKASDFTSRYNTRFYKLDWLGERLQYGKSPDSREDDYVDLRFVWKLEPQLEIATVDIRTPENNYEKAEVVGTISLSSGGGFKVERSIAVVEQDDLHTLLLWMFASLDKHNRNEKLKPQTPGNLPPWQLGKWNNLRLTMLGRRIDNDFRNENKYKDNTKRINVRSKRKLSLELEELSSGAFGKTHKGKDKLSNEPFVVKQFKAETESLEEKKEKNDHGFRDTARMARYEAMALVKLHASEEHPNINRIRDIVHDEEGFWLFLEWCDTSAKTWTEVHLGGSKNVDMGAVGSFVSGLLSGFERMHSAGMVHLDQKPQNLMFRGDVVTIIDLGTVDGPGITKDWRAWWRMPGTPGWWAPEELGYHTSRLTTMSFDQMCLVDSYKVGLLLFRLLGRAFLPKELWEKVVEDGAMLAWNEDSKAAEVSKAWKDIIQRGWTAETLRGEFGNPELVAADARALTLAVDAFGKSSDHSYFWAVCNALLPLIEESAILRRDVTTMYRMLVGENGKLLSHEQLKSRDTTKKVKRARRGGGMGHDLAFNLRTALMDNIKRRDFDGVLKLREQLIELGVNQGELDKNVIFQLEDRYFDDQMYDDLKSEDMAKVAKAQLVRSILFHLGRTEKDLTM